METIKIFIVNGQIVYIGGNCEPANSVRLPSEEKVRFAAPRDGGFSIEFKTESPFKSGAGKPGSPIVSADGSPTRPETLKSIPTVTRRFPFTTRIGGLAEDPEIIIDNGGGSEGSSKKPKKKKGKKKKK